MCIAIMSCLKNKPMKMKLNIIGKRGTTGEDSFLLLMKIAYANKCVGDCEICR